MDFFARQDSARKNTKLLVFYFVIAVILIVACVYLAVLFLFQGASNHGPRGAMSPSLWNPQIFLYSASGTLLIILGGSAVKIAELSSGGSAVAESLGGRLLNANTNDPHERKLLNVVEEMAIASGVPVPPVYVMDDERGINAFAAGHNMNDAAIGVTRGCITTLKRDELQGVIAHEFSHILNGDMRINLRLMGIIFGILSLAVIGRALLRVRSSGRNKNPLPLLGLVLLLLGWVGVFFGRLIQAAVSRQREFLADAAAVQFTRNPDGLAGALKKIGAAHLGSQIENEHAAEACHMFFGNALKHSLFHAFATHPPLEERIRALEPYWDGKYSQPAFMPEAEPPRSKQPATSNPLPPIIPGLPGTVSGLATPAAGVKPTAVIPMLGNPQPLHLRYAVKFRESLSDALTSAAHDPHGACALLFALVLSQDETQRQVQLSGLRQVAPAAALEQIVELLPATNAIVQRARLPLVNLTLPALRQLSPQDFQQFIIALNWLVESDAEINLFEFMLLKVIRHQVEPFFARRRPSPIQYYAIKPLLPDCAVLLSALAQSGHTDATDMAKAFQTGIPFLRATGMPVQLQTQEQSGLDAINTALDRLAQAAPQLKKNLLEACLHVVGADGLIGENEAELLRAIAETLDCPIPPFVTEAIG